LSLLRRVPWWGWVALAAMLYVGIQEYRIRALHGRLDAAKLEDLAKERATVKADVEALHGQRQALDASIDQAKAEMTGLRRELGTLRSDFARQEVERQRLVKSGTVDEIVQLGKSMGLHPMPARRPQ
jgi:hypothetical protein